MNLSYYKVRWILANTHRPPGVLGFVNGPTPQSPVGSSSAFANDLPFDLSKRQLEKALVEERIWNARLKTEQSKREYERLTSSETKFNDELRVWNERMKWK